MKIGIVCASLRFSGGRLVTLRHANELARRGHAVTVWTQDTDPVVDWMPLDVPVRHAANLRALPDADIYLFDRVRLASPLSQAGIGRAAHFCQGFEGTDAELRIRRAWSERGLFGLRTVWRQRGRRREIDSAYRLPTAKLVTHRHLGELIASRFGQPSFFVPYGLPTGVFTPPPSRPTGARTVLVVGPTDVGWKRVTDALRAVQLLKRRTPVRLVRVAQHEMRDAERGLGVTDEYHTMLAPPQMAELYRGADVLLCSSDATEGFGLPVLEAMACGLPCVVTDIPAFRTFARPDDYAHFVPVGDPARMAAALENLLASPDEQRRLRGRGLEVASEYTVKRSRDAMESALAAIAGGSSQEEAGRAPRIAA
jgi:glycosyltransferase involved in cell wall biosynthesis